MSLRGRMVMFVGDSTMRQLFVNFIPMVLGVSLVGPPKCGHDKLLVCNKCHGLMEVRIHVQRPWISADSPTTTTLTQVCYSDDATSELVLPRDPAADEIVLVSRWWAGLNCEVFEKTIRPVDCLRVSGGDEIQRRHIELLGPRVHAVVAHYGTHPVVRGGTRPCLVGFANEIEWLRRVTTNAQHRILVDNNPSELAPTQKEKLNFLLRAEADRKELPSAWSNARIAYCNRAQRDWVYTQTSSQDLYPHWQWIERFQQAWLAPEWSSGGPHYSALPAAQLIGEALCPLSAASIPQTR